MGAEERNRSRCAEGRRDGVAIVGMALNSIACNMGEGGDGIAGASLARIALHSRLPRLCCCLTASALTLCGRGNRRNALRRASS